MIWFEFCLDEVCYEERTYVISKCILRSFYEGYSSSNRRSKLLCRSAGRANSCDLETWQNDCVSFTKKYRSAILKTRKYTVAQSRKVCGLKFTTTTYMGPGRFVFSLV